MSMQNMIGKTLLLWCSLIILSVQLDASEQSDKHRQACQKVKALVRLPQQDNPGLVAWTPFIDTLLDLLEGLVDYEPLCNDLKLIRAPYGFRTLKLIKIAKKLNNHQEIFKKMCDREEPLSFAEGRQIAKHIQF